MARPEAAVVVSVRRCATADLSPADLTALRALLDAAFCDDFTDDDWRHGLGGQHALVVEGGALVAAGALVRRRMRHQGRELRVGYVENVAVHPDHRRRGLAGAVMASLEALAGHYDLLALSATEEGAELYESRGWEQWQGRTSVLAGSGVEPTPGDDGSVYVLPGEVELDLDADLTCDWRAGDVW